jgi:hypothetical protein
MLKMGEAVPLIPPVDSHGTDRDIFTSVISKRDEE